MEEPKDVTNPQSDMDVLGELRSKFAKKGHIRAKNASKKKVSSLKARFMFMGIYSILGIVLIALAGIKIAQASNDFYNANYLAKHPIVKTETGYKKFALWFSLPLTIEKREPLYIPVMTTANVKSGKVLTQEEKEQVVAKANFPRILNGMWMLETTQGKGKNDDDPTNHQSNCENVGMSNEFGYDPAHKFCFGSFEESIAFLDKYIEENLSNYSMNQLLCYYNTGSATDTCTYAKNFHALAKDGKLALK